MVTRSRHVDGTYTLHRQGLRGLEECLRISFIQQVKVVRSFYTSETSNFAVQSNKPEDQNPSL